MAFISASISAKHKNAQPIDNKKAIDWVSAPRKHNKSSVLFGRSSKIDNTLKLISGGFLYRDSTLSIVFAKTKNINVAIKLTSGGFLYFDNNRRLVFTDTKQKINQHIRIKHNASLPKKDVNYSAVWGKLSDINNHSTLLWGIVYATYNSVKIPWDKVPTTGTIRDKHIDTYPVISAPPIQSVNEILEVYFIMHSMSVVVLPSNTEIDVSTISIGIDIDSFAWTLSMSVLNGIELIRPDILGNKEILINIDGYIWEFIIESYRENKSFSDYGWTVTGRSKTAYLSSPYKLPISTTYTTLLNASQIINNELLTSGFTATYNTVDWLVDANAFSYQNLTSMQAIRRVSDAIGGVILPHQSSNSLSINPRYQLSPWDWLAAAQVPQITKDIIIKMTGNWRPKPNINGVYVRGNTVGVECFVKRTGTNGALLAPQITDNLITHQDAGREKGRNIISNRGKQEVITIELPVLPVGQTPAIYQCGDLLEVNEGLSGIWRGMIIGISISASASKGAIAATQTITLEKHYGNN